MNPDTLVGETLAGRYRIIDLIAKGGMGRIYRAEQLELGRLVALKVLEESTDDPEGFRKRFTLEAATSARLSHPNIVTVHDYGSFEVAGARRYFMALELIDGRTLSEVMKDEGPLDPARAAWLTREILRALREAHRQGVVHRDLKPSNVMISTRSDGDQVKVLDFGIAKVVQHDGKEEITREGAFVGTPRYMSPEQLANRPVDVRSDLFSLGVVLYQMLCGKPPHAGLDLIQAMFAHLNEAPPELPEPYRERTPEALRAVLERALQPEPRDRFQDATEMLRALDAASAGLSGWTTPAPSGELGISGERTSPSTGGGRSSASALRATPPERVHSPRPSDPPTLAETPGARGRPPDANAADPAPGPSARSVAIVAAVVATALLGAWALASSGGSLEAGTSPPPASHALAPPPSASTVPPRASFHLRVESEPAGATVLRDDAPIGTAPVSIELSLEALRAQPASIRVELEGYAPYRFTQGPSADDVTVRAPLVALPPQSTEALEPPSPPPTTRVRRDVRVRHDDAPPPPEDRMLKTRR